MEAQGLVVGRSSLLGSPFLGHDPELRGRACLPAPSDKQWSFRVGRRRLTLVSGRRRYAVDVRAKKADAGLNKDKSTGSDSAGDNGRSASGTRKLGKLPGTLKLPAKGGVSQKDKSTVFVAGATGKVGRRTVRELVKLGYNVRAGVRNVDKAQFLLEAVDEKAQLSDDEEDETPKKGGIFANFSFDKLFGFLTPKVNREGKVELVQCDLTNSVEDIEEAIGNAGVVICAIGASEKEVLDITGPYRIDFNATKNLIDAASSSNVKHFILVTSLGTQKIGWPAAALNLFWGVLIWKAKAEKALIASGIPFTIVRPGGMERPTDAYKETHNVRLAEADTLFGGQVSNLQVAELMAAVVENLDLAQDKILEVVAETNAPLRSYQDLLAEISRGKEERKPVPPNVTSVVKPIDTKKQEEDRAAALKRQEAEREKTEAIRQKLQQEYSAARLKQEEAQEEVEAAQIQKTELEKRAAEVRFRLEAAEQQARESKAIEAAVIKAAREGKLREKQDVVASVRAQIETERRKSEEAKQTKIPVKSKTSIGEGEAQKKANESKKQAEAKAKADAERAEKLRLEADKKAEEEETRKAREEEEKKKLEADLKAKQEEEKLRIEAQRKKEEEEKKKAEALAREDEERLRIEAEREAKEEEEKKKAEERAREEEKLRIEAEQKAKKEEEKRRTEDEQKAKEEEVERRRIQQQAEEDDRKKRLEAEQMAREAEDERNKIEAAKKTKEEENSSAQDQPRGFLGFRWPWQQEEVSEESSQPETSSTQEPISEELPRTSRPLSPYAQYPTLKPPFPPRPPSSATAETNQLELESPSSQTSSAPDRAPVPQESEDERSKEIAAAQERVAKAQEEAEENQKAEKLKELAAEQALASKAREDDALEKARAAVGFRWPWQTQEAEVIATEAKAAVRKSDLPRGPKPLSPYSMYPDLKPPRPPNPPRATEQGEGSENGLAGKVLEAVTGSQQR